MKKFLSFGIIATFVLALLFAIPMQTKAADSRVIELQAQINKLSSIIETLKANRTLQGMVKGAFTIPGDVNGDGTVNITDLNAVISAWGPCVSKICPADLNNSGAVNIDDLTIVINNWTQIPAAQIYTRLSPTSPAAPRIILTNSKNITPNVVLGVFGLKAQNQNATVSALSFNLVNSLGVPTTTIFSNVRLIDGNNSYQASNLVAGGGNTFINLNISLPLDQWKDLVVIADINPNNNNFEGAVASTTLLAQTIVGVDEHYNNLIVTGANITAFPIILQSTPLIVSGIYTNLGTCYGGNMTYVDNKCPMTMTFTVGNIGNSDVYLSKTPAIALSTSTSIASGPFPVASSTLSSINITAVAGDTPTSYRVASGTSRTFTYQGILSKTAAGGFESFKITAVKYGALNVNGIADTSFNSQTLTPNSNSSSKINSGLENLFVANTFGAI